MAHTDRRNRASRACVTISLVPNFNGFKASLRREGSDDPAHSSKEIADVCAKEVEDAGDRLREVRSRAPSEDQAHSLR